MRVRSRVSAAAAALGALCLLLVPFSRDAVAASRPIDIFDGRGVGQGVVATFAVRPSIFDPLAQGGFDYVETSFNAQGGGISQAIAAPAFPGKLALGALTPAVGCGGLKGWVEARYPPSQSCKTHQEDAVIAPARSTVGEAFGAPQADDAINAVLDRARPSAGIMTADALLGSAAASIRSAGFVVGDAEMPVLEIGEMLMRSGGARAGGIVENTTQVIAQEVSLLGGIVRIDAIVSTASTRSDGTTGIADASLTFGTVLVESGGETHEATIDDRGIRVTDADLDEDARIGVEEEIEEALLRAGLSLRAGAPTEITEGAQADAAVGGLTLSFSAELPSVAVPDQAAGVYGTLIENFPTKCVREITHEDRPDQLAPITDNLPQIPLCFGAGVIPSGGSVPAVSLTIANAQSYTSGSYSIVFDPVDPGSFPPPPPPVDTVDGTVPTGPGAPSTPPFEPGDGGSVVTQPPPAVLLGRVARLPAIALAWAGAALLVLAVGSAIRPSLRHAGSQ